MDHLISRKERSFGAFGSGFAGGRSRKEFRVKLRLAGFAGAV